MSKTMLYVGVCAVAAINARAHRVIETVHDDGLLGAAAATFGISAVIWCALIAAWVLARGDESPAPLSRGDVVVLGLLAVAALLPFPHLAAFAGLLAPIQLYITSPPQSVGRRVALILFAVSAQMVFGRLFLMMFSEPLLWLDTALVGLAGDVATQGNVMQSVDGRSLIVTAGCSSMHNLSLAILAWVVATQLFRLAFNARVALWVLASMAAMFAVNSMRMIALAWYPQQFDYLHDGAGSSLFGWAAYLALALILWFGIIHIEARQHGR